MVAATTSYHGTAGKDSFRKFVVDAFLSGACYPPPFVDHSWIERMVAFSEAESNKKRCKDWFEQVTEMSSINMQGPMPFRFRYACDKSKQGSNPIG